MTTKAMMALVKMMVVVAAIFTLSPLAMAQIIPPDPGDFGDAPEGAEAYPSLGVPGWFPTCRGGPAGAVYHANQAPLAWFGPTMDTEIDGNAGFCPAPPYEMDECWGAADGDGGLVNTSTYTIFQNQVSQCSSGPVDPLGQPCSTLQWGADIDIQVTNLSGNDALINVLFDWNQDGKWNGSSLCPGGNRLEHVIWNLSVPDGYAGLLSGLSPPPLLVGPNSGYVWVRFTIGDPVPMMYDWDGSFVFDTGETEDYLLFIDDTVLGAGELGDAPEEVTAYPNGIMGHFPTCVATGPAGFVFHTPPITGFLGNSYDLESDGNHDNCTFTPYDNDECHYNDGDAGLLYPASYRLVNGRTLHCGTSTPASLGDPCQQVTWGRNIDLEIDNSGGPDLFLNGLADWDQGGSWGQVITCANGTSGPEHFLVNVIVPAGFQGPVSTLGLSGFPILSDAGYVWFRFTLSDVQITSNDWHGEGHFGDGETEDYLLYVGSPTDVPAMETGLRLLPAMPNPFNPSTTISYLQPRSGLVQVTVHDVAGHLVRILVNGARQEGTHRVEWDGRDDAGRIQDSGVFFVRIASNGEVDTGKLMLLK